MPAAAGWQNGRWLIRFSEAGTLSRRRDDQVMARRRRKNIDTPGLVLSQYKAMAKWSPETARRIGQAPAVLTGPARGRESGLRVDAGRPDRTRLAAGRCCA